MQNIGSEIAPVTAVLGGQLAQDVINVLGHRQQPIQNMVLFDGELNEAPMYALHPEGPLGRDLLPLSEGLVNKVETTPVMDQAVLPVPNIGMPA
jgi:ubiquitin-like 1-activating enzyme E1 A